MIRSKEGYFQITNTWQDSENEIITSDFPIISATFIIYRRTDKN
ncbi:hypothetical protein B4088_1033 [Bacillus cereus]|uniref:Uncharacterized protein n=1 Tax=Bacillus cereus TaxID=1396 RepID=A0A164QAY1_BACCE|nr:hypothetical protein B4088_1033 [Bacillus cereus]